MFFDQCGDVRWRTVLLSKMENGFHPWLSYSSFFLLMLHLLTRVNILVHFLMAVGGGGGGAFIILEHISSNHGDCIGSAADKRVAIVHELN